MLMFILRRLGVMILTAFALTFIVFSLTNLPPNLEKLAKSEASVRMTDDQVVSWIANNGFDTPMISRYGQWLGVVPGWVKTMEDGEVRGRCIERARQGNGGRGWGGWRWLRWSLGRGRQRGPQRGADLTMSTTVDFIDSIHGATLKLRINNSVEPTSVKVPAGIQDGQKIKLRGKGQPSPNGGEPGDLLITVTVKPHPVFTRDGNNLRVNVPVTFAEAVLGATIQVPTLGGEPVKLKVAPGTPNGRVLRVKGKGVQSAKAVGDLLATVDIAVPSHVSDKAAKVLEEFSALLGDEDPREDLLRKAGLL